EHVGDGLETPVRVVGKAGDVVGGIHRGEVVHHQVGIHPLVGSLAKGALEAHAGTIAGFLGRIVLDRCSAAHTWFSWLSEARSWGRVQSCCGPVDTTPWGLMVGWLRK